MSGRGAVSDDQGGRAGAVEGAVRAEPFERQPPGAGALDDVVLIPSRGQLEHGMHAVLELPAGWDEDDIIERARTRGLALEGLGAYGTLDGTRPPALIIGYGTPPAHAYTAALAR